MKASWSGIMKFGAISIPVKMYNASGSIKVGFSTVHDEDKGAIGHKNYCKVCGKEVAQANILKAFTIGDKVLTFTDEEIEALRPESNKEMTIKEFCELKEIPLVAIDAPMYIGTDAKSKVKQGFSLLKQAMVESGKVAIVQWVNRTTENLGVLIPYRKGFMLKILLFSEQIKDMEEVEIEEAEISTDLVKKGVAVIEKMTKKFNLTEFKETQSAALKEVIEKRALGEEVAIKTIKKPAEASLEAELNNMLV